MRKMDVDRIATVAADGHVTGGDALGQAALHVAKTTPIGLVGSGNLDKIER